MLPRSDEIVATEWIRRVVGLCLSKYTRSVSGGSGASVVLEEGAAFAPPARPHDVPLLLASFLREHTVLLHDLQLPYARLTPLSSSSFASASPDYPLALFQPVGQFAPPSN